MGSGAIAIRPAKIVIRLAKIVIRPAKIAVGSAAIAVGSGQGNRSCEILIMRLPCVLKVLAPGSCHPGSTKKATFAALNDPSSHEKN